MAILDDVKIALRISATAFDDEITDLIDAAMADLKLSGVVNSAIVTTDPLIKRAVVTFCRANFGMDNPDAERLQACYDMIKAHLTLASDYNTEPAS